MKLTAKSHPTSKTSVHQCRTMCLHLKSLKLRRQLKMTEVQKRKRVAFAKACKNWTILQWRPAGADTGRGGRGRPPPSMHLGIRRPSALDVSFSY